jgi:hypothetical protein
VVVNLSYNKIITFLGYYDNSNLPTFHPLQLFFPTKLYTRRDDKFYTTFEKPIVLHYVSIAQKDKNAKGVAFLMIIQ